MFVGHYAAGFALKAVEKKASLGMLFIASQFVDIMFFLFVPFGIEKFNLVENYTAANHMELYYYPYTHGLLGGAVWAALIYGLWRGVPALRGTRPNRVALVMALAVLSHWFFDLIMHTPDMPLLGNDGVKLGFGIWQNLTLTVGVELGLLLASILYYVRKTTSVTGSGKYAVWVLTALMVGGYVLALVLPFDPTMTPTVAGMGGLLFYALFAAGAFWVDRSRA